MYDTEIQYTHLIKGESKMTSINPDIKNKIINAAETLITRGDDVTNKAVRDILGGTSFSHISPVMREWRQNQERTKGTMLEMPGILKTSLERFGAELWNAADSEARKKVELIQTASDKRITTVELELEEALKEIQSLEINNELLKDEKKKLANDIEDRKTALTNEEKTTQTLTIELEKASVTITAANKRANEYATTLEKSQKQQDKLQSELIALVKETSKLVKVS